MIILDIIKGLFLLTFWIIKSIFRFYAGMFSEQPEITLVLTVIIVISWFL
ncbi:hypothetical protein K4I05_1565 [Streptococcus sanguinis]|nr:hypothetical protein [Streptococcus sanguinis]